jgi:hypothetical protein
VPEQPVMTQNTATERPTAAVRRDAAVKMGEGRTITA